MIDKQVIAVFIGVIASMAVSSVVLYNHPTECYIQITQRDEARIYVGTTLPKVTEVRHE